jgi:hypothetical protein
MRGKKLEKDGLGNLRVKIFNAGFLTGGKIKNPREWSDKKALARSYSWLPLASSSLCPFLLVIFVGAFRQRQSPGFKIHPRGTGGRPIQDIKNLAAEGAE